MNDWCGMAGQASLVTPTWAKPIHPGGELDLWWVNLDEIATDTALLSQEERERAKTIIKPLQRQRALATRYALRRILGRYLEIPSETIPLSREPEGKPYVPGHPVHFNLTHSRERALFAISRKQAVGVDLEAGREPRQMMAIARRLFTPEVVEAVLALTPGERRGRAFAEAWTSLEASQKLSGRGVFAERQELPLLTWLMPEPDWIAALAVKTRPTTFAFYRYDLDF